MTPEPPLGSDGSRTLDSIRELFQTTDPMPPDLPERIRFALALRHLEVEVARVAEADERAVAVRGTECSRTVTFDSDSLTIMIRIDANPDGTARIDGWLAPAQRSEIEMKIEMKTGPRSLSAACDEHGRFVFARVPRGTAQLLVRPAPHENGEESRLVVTQPLIL
jgi:hypothetical protein